MGAGIGLTGYVGSPIVFESLPIGSSLFGADDQVSEVFGVLVMLIAFLFGPIIAALSGFLTAASIRERKMAAIVAGVGSFVGFYVMVVVAVVGIGAGAPGGGPEFWEHVGAVALAGVPTGAVGALFGVICATFR